MAEVLVARELDDAHDGSTQSGGSLQTLDDAALALEPLDEPPLDDDEPLDEPEPWGYDYEDEAPLDGDDGEGLGPNPWRDEIVRTIFGDVGAIRRDFSCAIERKILLHGRLYVTERFICFYSNLFGFEKKIKIPYSHITCITKEYTAVFIPNAIAVITARKEYVFRSFWDRDDCFDLLKSFHESFRGLAASAGDGLESESADRGEKPDGDMEDLGGAMQDTGPEDPASPTDAGEVAFDRVEDAPPLRPMRKKPSRASPTRAATRRRGTRAAGPSRAVDGDVLVLERAATPPPPPGAARPVRPSRSDDRLVDTPQHESAEAARFAEHVASTKLATVLRECVLDVDVEGFFEHFLSDAATFPLARFHETEGDLDISTTPWVSAARGEHDRELRFRRLITSPIGPPSTRTTKVQRVKAFGKNGLVMHTVMSMEDIPYRDCFTIHDRWVVRPADGDPGTTRVTFEFEVKWTKSTIWKRRIESSPRRTRPPPRRRRGAAPPPPEPAAPEAAKPAAPAAARRRRRRRAGSWAVCLAPPPHAANGRVLAELRALQADVALLKAA
ncbi:hypothetical protein JL722_2472 [Aureococcus anophagefferens]|nr:hypothetical protein JL722_2472 [Aureococcus anophagefferens]